MKYEDFLLPLKHESYKLGIYIFMILSHAIYNVFKLYL